MFQLLAERSNQIPPTPQCYIRVYTIRKVKLNPKARKVIKPSACRRFQYIRVYMIMKIKILELAQNVCLQVLSQNACLQVFAQNVCRHTFLNPKVKPEI